MIFYLTYAEPLSGVYRSQVCDVIRFLNSTGNEKVRLMAFLSLHGYSKASHQLKKELPGSITFPMLPRSTWWKLNTFFLMIVCLVYRPRAILARNVIAANMALACRNAGLTRKVCFDGRGAIAAEWEEYDVTVAPNWKKNSRAWEKKAVQRSDFRIAVSSHLVGYWKERYQYSSENHVVIPCTLHSSFEANKPEIDITEGDKIVIVYSGSTAGWQSFGLLGPFLKNYLSASKLNTLLFLSTDEELIRVLDADFPGQVTRMWLPHEKVEETLSTCDAGILIREQSVTNRVASPTKYAEYIACGLPVLISEGLGDYSQFTIENNCGWVIRDSQLPLIPRKTPAEASRLRRLALNSFTKAAHRKSYEKMMEHLLNPMTNH